MIAKGAMMFVQTLVRFILGSLLVFAANAWPQTYPAKPIRIIVGGPLGGPSDFPARGIGFFLGPHFNQTFVIENKAGANAILGAEACAKAAPDGYTLCLLNSTVISFNPFWYKKIPYEPRDFVPIAHMGIIVSDGGINIPRGSGSHARSRNRRNSLPATARTSTARCTDLPATAGVARLPVAVAGPCSR